MLSVIYRWRPRNRPWENILKIGNYRKPQLAPSQLLSILLLAGAVCGWRSALPRVPTGGGGYDRRERHPAQGSPWRSSAPAGQRSIFGKWCASTEQWRCWEHGWQHRWRPKKRCREARLTAHSLRTVVSCALWKNSCTNWQTGKLTVSGKQVAATALPHLCRRRVSFALYQ